MICRNYVRSLSVSAFAFLSADGENCCRQMTGGEALSLRILGVFNPQLIIMIITLISLHLNLSLNFRIQGWWAVGIIHLSHWSRIWGFFHLCSKSFQGILSNNHLFCSCFVPRKTSSPLGVYCLVGKQATHCRLMAKARVVVQIRKKINRQQGPSTQRHLRRLCEERPSKQRSLSLDTLERL